MSTTTPSMSLIVPTVGDSDYPTSISSSLTTLDTHTHASGSGVQIPTAGITNLAVTRAKLAAVGEQVSASCGAFLTISTTAVDVTNLSVTITTTGRPVMIGLIPDGTASSASLFALRGPGMSGGINVDMYLLEDAVIVGQYTYGFNFSYTTPPGMFDFISYPVGSVSFIRPVAAGTYTYKLQMLVNPLGAQGNVGFAKLFAYEL